VQPVAVAVAVKLTASGAVPEDGEAEAEQVTVQVLQPVVVMEPEAPVKETDAALASDAVGVPDAWARV
jgi:hypothetical protein